MTLTYDVRSGSSRILDVAKRAVVECHWGPSLWDLAGSPILARPLSVPERSYALYCPPAIARATPLLNGWAGAHPPKLAVWRMATFSSRRTEPAWPRPTRSPHYSVY